MNKIIFQNKQIIKFIIISKKYGNFIIKIDAEDWNKIKDYQWNIKPSYHTFYVCSSKRIDNKIYKYRLHRLILNANKDEIIDHKDHNGLNNRKNNLRRCTTKENLRNKKLYKNNNSGYKGVTWHKYIKKWYVTISINKKAKSLGYFEDKIEAAKIYNKAAKKYFGEFAKLNII